MTIAVPFLNSERFVEDTLGAMLRTEYNRLRIILIYNPSIDRTLEIIKRLIEGSSANCILLANSATKSFQENCNIALSMCNDTYFVRANDDLLFDDSLWLRKLVGLANCLPRLGAISPCLRDWDGSVIQCCGGSKLPFTFEPRNFIVRTPEPSAFEAYTFNGGLILGRTSVLKSVGSFWMGSNPFNSYGEDIELALRLRESGYSCYVTNVVQLRHLGGGTLGRDYSKFATKSYESFKEINQIHIRNKAKLALYNRVSSLILKYRQFRAQRDRRQGWR